VSLFFAPLSFGLERSESLGTFASAGGARKSEQKGVAAEHEGAPPVAEGATEVFGQTLAFAQAKCGANA